MHNQQRTRMQAWYVYSAKAIEEYKRTAQGWGDPRLAQSVPDIDFYYEHSEELPW